MKNISKLHCSNMFLWFSLSALGRIPSSSELLLLASQSGTSPWKLPGMPGLGMGDLSSLIASANPQQAAAHFASLYFGIPRAFFPSGLPSHLSNMNSASSNLNADGMSGTPRTSTAGYPQQLNSSALTNQALYTTRLQLSGLYPGLRFHPYFQPRLVHPTPTTKSPMDSTTDCDSMSPNVWSRFSWYNVTSEFSKSHDGSKISVKIIIVPYYQKWFITTI